MEECTRNNLEQYELTAIMQRYWRRPGNWFLPYYQELCKLEAREKPLRLLSSSHIQGERSEGDGLMVVYYEEVDWFLHF